MPMQMGVGGKQRREEKKKRNEVGKEEEIEEVDMWHSLTGQKDTKKERGTLGVHFMVQMTVQVART